MLLVEGLAAYRLTRLVTADSITRGPREAIIEVAYDVAGKHSHWQAEATTMGWDHVAHTDPDVPKVAELVTCRWCAGMWVAAGMLLLRRLAPRLYRPLCEALALSAGAALLARLEDD